MRAEKKVLMLSQLADYLDAELIGEDQAFSSISINTRTIAAGDLFVAIKGENFDAHEYVQQAEKKGAIALILEHDCGSSLAQIQVEDTREALAKIAELWRSSFNLSIVAITGSCGKTTVKEMTAAIFKQKFISDEAKQNDDGSKVDSSESEKVLATSGNLNNDIGVPLTLMRLNNEHQAAVIEIGANHKGEIKQLVALVKPDVAVITNVAHAHIEGFGSLEGVAEAKAEIYTGIKKGGTAIINADDPFSEYWIDYCQKSHASCSDDVSEENFGTLNILSFGLNNAADISAEYKQQADGLELVIKTLDAEQLIKLKQFGKHNVYNALAATALATSCGCQLEDVKKGLEAFTNIAGRLEQKQGINGAVIFDDTYNANPGSVRAGIEAIQQLEGEAVLILGDMGELGETSAELHFQLGVDAEKMGIKTVYTLGVYSQETYRGFKKNNKLENRAMHFSNKETLIEKVTKDLQKKNVVLVKGSRTMGMEIVVDALVKNKRDEEKFSASGLAEKTKVNNSITEGNL